MNGMSEKEEREQRNAEVEEVARRHFFGNKAAVALAKRIYNRNYYRRRRDRRLTEWLGRTFEYSADGRDELGRRWGMAEIRITSYNPLNHTVVVWMSKGTPTPCSIAWDTDHFWRQVKEGRMKRC